MSFIANDYYSHTVIPFGKKLSSKKDRLEVVYNLNKNSSFILRNLKKIKVMHFNFFKPQYLTYVTLMNYIIV